MTNISTLATLFLYLSLATSLTFKSPERAKARPTRARAHQRYLHSPYRSRPLELSRQVRNPRRQIRPAQRLHPLRLRCGILQ